MDDIDLAVAETLEYIDRRGAPERMSKEDWRTFLRSLIFDIQVRLEEVEAELREDKEKKGEGHG